MIRGVFILAAVTLVAAVSFGATIHVPSQQPTSTVTDYDGNVYKTVRIGSQVWMAENLKTTHYSNGDSIPNVSDRSDWANLLSGAYCSYANDTSISSIYGKFYNWYAATDIRKIAPVGWHVPDDDEFQLLVDYLGGSSVAGGKMKDTGTVHWIGPNVGATNESGFTALPGGGRTFEGDFQALGEIGYFMTTSLDGSGWVLYRYLYRASSEAYQWSNGLGPGLLVRCLQDHPADIESVSFGEESAHMTVYPPVITWQLPVGSLPQDSFQIEVGVDTDWSIAEMWNPAPFNSSDTFVTYAGAPLVDGQTYFLRLRISDGVSWSSWYYTSFHMKTPPTAPVPYAPQWPDITVSTTPDLSVVNATDAENDTLYYDYQVFRDSMLTDLAVEGTHVAQTNNPDSTSWTVTPPLDDNKYYYWRARAFDGYEYSPWSSMRFFIANNANEPPNPFILLDPPDSTGSILYNRKPTFRWTYTGDPDPYNQVRYKLELGSDPGFFSKHVEDSLYTSFWIPPDSLPYHSHYWWRVSAIDQYGGTTLGTNTNEFWTWTLGDVDHSNNVDISDLTRMIDYLYISFAPILPRKVGDLDGDCIIDIADLSRLIDHLYITLTLLTVGGCEQ